jgi:bis(5'-nucleosidyl)-tetraphosphatase
MAPTEAGGLFIYRINSDKIEYLLLKASYGSFHWTPPKGHVRRSVCSKLLVCKPIHFQRNTGESMFNSALRETKEETGYSDQDLHIHGNVDYTLFYKVRNGWKTVNYWLTKLRDPQLMPTLSEEHTEYKFVNKTEMIRMTGFKDFAAMTEFFDGEIRLIHGMERE